MKYRIGQYWKGYRFFCLVIGVLLGGLCSSAANSDVVFTKMDENVASVNAKNMIEKKALDAVCLNIINEKNSFGSNNNEIELLFKNENENVSLSGEKLELSLKLLKKLEENFHEC